MCSTWQVKANHLNELAEGFISNSTRSDYVRPNRSASTVRACTATTCLPLVDGYPVRCGEPLVALYVVDAVLQVAIALGQVHLQQVPQQVF